MQIIALANNKGGVGKSSMVFALATGLKHLNKKILVIDADPQCNTTYSLGIDSNLQGLYEVLKGAKANEIIVTNDIGIDVIPGSHELEEADNLFTKTGKEYLLNDALDGLDEKYDFIICDLPPHLGVLTDNIFTIADKVIIPMETDAYSLQGLNELYERIGDIQKHFNADLKIDGLLINKYDNRAVINRTLKDTIGEIAKDLGTKCYKTTIRASSYIKEAGYQQQDIYTLYPRAKVTGDLRAFINEFMGRKVYK